MKYYSFIFSILLLSIGCSSKKEVEIIEIETLRESQLYDFDNVKAYMLKHASENEKIANQYVEKYEAALKDNPQKALYYFKRAISLEPTLERYKKLGTFLIDLKKYDEAYSLYSLITNTHAIPEDPEANYVYLFEEPDADTKYEQLVAQLFQSFQAYLVREAVDTDASLKDKLLEEKRFMADTSNAIYKKLKFVLNNEETENLVFTDVYKYIKDTNSVFEINTKMVNAFEYLYSSDMEYEYKAEHEYSDYSSFLQEAKGKENYYGSFNFTHLHKISPSVIAIVYSVDTSATACPKDMRHIYHRLATYTPNGEIIDTKVVAWQAGEQQATMKYDNGNITISEIKRTWKNPYDKRDFDNFILKTETIGSKTFQILPEGKIEERSAL